MGTSNCSSVKVGETGQLLPAAQSPRAVISHCALLTYALVAVGAAVVCSSGSVGPTISYPEPVILEIDEPCQPVLHLNAFMTLASDACDGGADGAAAMTTSLAAPALCFRTSSPVRCKNSKVARNFRGYLCMAKRLPSLTCWTVPRMRTCAKASNTTTQTHGLAGGRMGICRPVIVVAS
jgi:hypothetical protein